MGLGMRIERNEAGMGGSKQFTLWNGSKRVCFSVMEDELCAHTWNCIGEGREFLKELEWYADFLQLQLTVPTVINPKLRTILEDNGYSKRLVEFEPEPNSVDWVEIWSKQREVIA